MESKIHFLPWGEIRVIDLFFDKQLWYTMSLPQDDNQANQVVTLPFSKHNAFDHELFISEGNILSIKNLDLISKITLKAGLFTKKLGSLHSHDLRSNIPIELDVSSLRLGNHYKIIVTHNYKPIPSLVGWEGKGLHTMIVVKGPSHFINNNIEESINKEPLKNPENSTVETTYADYMDLNVKEEASYTRARMSK